MKGETIEDMFADDVDLGDTFDFSTGEVVEVKKEETNSTVDITQILDNALNSDMFDDDDESLLFQANQAAEVEMVVKKEPAVVATRSNKFVK